MLYSSRFVSRASSQHLCSLSQAAVEVPVAVVAVVAVVAPARAVAAPARAAAAPARAAAAPARAAALGSPKRVKIGLLANRRVPLLRSHPNSKDVLREATEQLKAIQRNVQEADRGCYNQPEADKFVAHLHRRAVTAMVSARTSRE
jgi:hypothetical protein